MRPPVYHRRFGYDLNQLPNQKLKDLEAGVSDIDEARRLSGATIGYPGWSVIYSSMLASLNPTVRDQIVVETGTNFGSSTIVLAQALKDACGSGTVHTFEIDPDNLVVARRHIEEAGLSRFVAFHEGDARVELPKFIQSLDQQVSFAFLDGAHEAQTVMAELDAIIDRLAPHALVALDNTYPISEPEKGDPPRVNQALPLILERFGGQLINLRFASWFTPGLALWQKETPLTAQSWSSA